jgi:uncharacterized protein involved in response to NO
MILLTGAYRLFFPAAGLMAALAVPFWLALYRGADIPGPEDAQLWHMHEMLFGYLGAALAGFLLTALPNWTGRRALTGLPLLGLFVLWLLGRVVMLLWPEGALLALAFPAVLAGIATFEIIAGGNIRNLPMAAMVWLITGAQAVMLMGDVYLGARLGFAIALMMITLIGGRVTPAFSRNWLKAQGRADHVAEFGQIDKAALISTALALLAWVILGAGGAPGALALLASGILGLRLIRWNAPAVRDEPLLLALHAGYGWVVVSLLLLGLQGLTGLITQAQVFHAMGAGAVGTMTLIIMIRAVLGHSGREITAAKPDSLLLLMVHGAALLRVIAGGIEAQVLLHLSGTLWALGFGLFALRYLRLALLPKIQS